MFKRFDVVDPEPAWDDHTLADLILAERQYQPSAIGDAASFWRR